MDGLMMEYPLTLAAILRRAEVQFPERAVVTLTSPTSSRRVGYAALADRARSLAVGLAEMGVEPDDRVASLCVNHAEHLEAYFGVPLIGGILHTLNPRLHPDDLAFILGHGGARVVIVDHALLPVLEGIRDRVRLDVVVVVGGEAAGVEAGVAYEEVVGRPVPGARLPHEPDERRAAVLCYTSGTTGTPKGVLYSHRSLVLHSLASAHADVLDVREDDTVMPVVPMFHVNAWGLPFTSALVGAGQVLPGPQVDPASLLAAVAAERVTVAAAVPTLWLGVLAALDARADAHDVSSLRSVIVGGSAAPPVLIEGLERHGLRALHAWGMTEMTPVGTVSRVPPGLPVASEEALRIRAKQGRAMPLVEVRARGEAGLVPWDGAAMGELEVRGPAVAGSYFAVDAPDRFTPDGWFRTGDIVTIDPRGFVEITDRDKDLVKSGGEWISSVALENALMGHPAVAEAAVVAVPDPRWGERPLAVVALRDGREASAEELVEHLRPGFPRWWLPDGVEFVDAIPRTATGKFKKADLRERFADRDRT
jgi:fatty-acyl-CoA synthase